MIMKSVLLGAVFAIFIALLSLATLSPTTDLTSICWRESVILVATIDGTIYFVETDQHPYTILHTVSLRSQMYSSHQDGLEGSFIDCGADWLLYRYDHGKAAPKKLGRANMFIGDLQRLSEGAIEVDGSQITTKYVIDLESGNILDWDSYNQKTNSVNPVGKVRMSLTRTAYEFKGYDNQASKCRWNLTFSELLADCFCSTEDLFSCRKKINVYRLRGETIGNGSSLELSVAELVQKHGYYETHGFSHSSNVGLLFLVVFIFVFMVGLCLWQFEVRKQNDPSLSVSGSDETSKPCGHNVPSKLIVSETLIGIGSNGTMVFEGTYDGRKVAVKRLVLSDPDLGRKEMDVLHRVDEHPNVVTFYHSEVDKDFRFLCLEYCLCNLHDLICHFSTIPQTTRPKALPQEILNINDLGLWTKGGFPAPQLLGLLRDTMLGLRHLHRRGFIHRDVKPQNVLIWKDDVLRAKISDMGVAKYVGSSSAQHTGGVGTIGWQAPEVLNNGIQTSAVDIFGFGMVMFFCLTKGRHPFGDPADWVSNIKNDKKKHAPIVSCPGGS